MDGGLREIIFWVIFLSVALLLIYSQLVISKPAIVAPPSPVSEYLPDIVKTQKDAILFYENITYEKLKASPGKRFLYGLGEYSGPIFKENLVKEGAFQTALQDIINSLENKKEELKQIASQKGFTDLNSSIDKMFLTLYQYLSNDASLVVTYKIWKKLSNQILTYYYLVLFDDEYALAIVELYSTEEVAKFKDKGLDLQELWRTLFNK